MLAPTDEALAKAASHKKPSRQRAYYHRKRAGLSVIRLCADPVTIAELLREAGIFVAYSDPASVGAGLEELLRRWELGQLEVSESG